jgi:mono/diheme cytochrome c family protein
MRRRENIKVRRNFDLTSAESRTGESRSCSFLIAFVLVGVVAVASTTVHNFHHAPYVAVHRRNPLPNDETALKNGRELFLTYCSQCHGREANGAGKALRLDAGPTQTATEGELFWFITKGEPEKGMPSWVYALSEQQRWQVVTYLKSIRARHPSK